MREWAVPSLLRIALLAVATLPFAAPAAAQAYRVKDIRPGSMSGQPRNFARLGDLVLFQADDGTSGGELWKSDGTAGGTVLVSDIRPGVAGSNPEGLFVSNGLVFFLADDLIHDRQLWRSDGTAAGTFRISNIITGDETEIKPVDVNGTVFFSASRFHEGYDLWKSDGTVAGTTLVREAFNEIGELVNVGGTVFFAVKTSSIGGSFQLWKSDGTSEGTVRVTDDLYSSTPFVSQVAFQGSLFFCTSGLGYGLWRSDGTPAGTVRLTGEVHCEDLTPVGPTLFFKGWTDTNDVELWKTNGASDGTVLVKNIDPEGDSSPGLITKVGDSAFFAASTIDLGREVWKSDGTTEGTVLVKDIRPLGLSAQQKAPFLDVNGVAYFDATNGVHGQELWKSDGTEEGTVMVQDLNPNGSSLLDGLRGVVRGDLLFFSADDQAGTELWALPLPLSLSVHDVGIREGNTGSLHAAFTVTLSRAAASTVEVDYATADGTATAGSDYAATSGRLSFPPGVTTRTLEVAINGDTSIEADETFFVRLSSPNGATIGRGQGTGSIGDDDAPPAPALSISDVTITEGDTGHQFATFTVSLSAPSGVGVSVHYRTADGTAHDGDRDYLLHLGSLFFPPGETTMTVEIWVYGDTTIEPDETFFVNLFDAHGAAIADFQGVATIVNDDFLPTISINDVTVTEGYSGTTIAGFTVSLSLPHLETVTVSYATEDGSATAGSDYTPTSGTITFPPLITSRSVSVAVRGDHEDEPDETFFVNLSNPANATIEDGQGRALIPNDDLASPGSFFTVVPCRALDTRSPVGLGGPALFAGETRVLTLFGVCDIPPTAKAISVNLAVTQPTAAGNLRLYPAGTAPPTVSAINYTAGQTRTNNAILRLNTEGLLAVWCAQASGTTHFILDVNGYFE